MEEEKREWYWPPHMVVVIREFRNWVASCIRMTERDNKPVESEINEKIISLYENHITSFLENGDSDSVTFILFDKWATDPEYRKETCEKLGLTFTDAAKEQLSIFGGGSSFDNMNFLKEASKMDVTNRYKTMEDNPFYKVAEHLFVGVSAGYLLSLGFWTQLQPNLFGRLFPAKHYDPDTITYTIYNILSFFSSSIFPAGGIDKGHDQHLIYLIPLILGIMMLMSLIPRFSWMARWGIAYVVGMAAGLKAYGYLNSNVIGQIKGTAVNIFDFSLPIFSLSSPSVFNNLIIFVGTICGLLYFYFSK